jgi:hypothetical protein
MPRRKTKRKNSGSCRPRWRCDCDATLVTAFFDILRELLYLGPALCWRSSGYLELHCIIKIPDPFSSRRWDLLHIFHIPNTSFYTDSSPCSSPIMNELESSQNCTK